jgi:hypothetical protein
MSKRPTLTGPDAACLEFGTHALQNTVDQDAQLSQRVRRRDGLFQRPVAEHGGLGVVGLAHGIK